MGDEIFPNTASGLSGFGEPRDEETFEEAFDGWVRETEEQIEATRRSEVLTAEDYAVTINATSDYPREELRREGHDIVPRQAWERWLTFGGK